MTQKFKFRYVNEIVGGFVLLVFLLLLVGVLIAGHAQHWFEGMGEIDLKFPPEGSMELQKGAEVMLLGAKVGSVQDINVDDEGNITGSIRVRGPFMRFVREDSIALVKKKMVVTGDAFIELTRGTGEPLPKSGGEIQCVMDTAIMQILEDALACLLYTSYSGSPAGRRPRRRRPFVRAPPTLHPRSARATPRLSKTPRHTAATQFPSANPANSEGFRRRLESKAPRPEPRQSSTPGRRPPPLPLARATMEMFRRSCSSL